MKPTSSILSFWFNDRASAAPSYNHPQFATNTKEDLVNKTEEDVLLLPFFFGRPETDEQKRREYFLESIQPELLLLDTEQLVSSVAMASSVSCRTTGKKRPTDELLGIMDQASDIVDIAIRLNKGVTFLEPTPIASRNIKVVDHATISQPTWVREDSLVSNVIDVLSADSTHGSNSGKSCFPSLYVPDESVVRYGLERRTSKKSPVFTGLNPVLSNTDTFSTESPSPPEPSKKTSAKRKRGDVTAVLARSSMATLPQVVDTDYADIFRQSVKAENAAAYGTTPRKDRGEEDDTGNNNGRFRVYQAEQWLERFQEMIGFRKHYGHCLVPNTFPENPYLAQWVKRQRYQYKLKHEGKHSTLTDDRDDALEQLGFVWDSHRAGWTERYKELAEYRRRMGHSNVPTNDSQNRQLSIWVKCQRRQYRLCQSADGRATSNMTPDRISKLESLDFVWSPRSGGRRSLK